VCRWFDSALATTLPQAVRLVFGRAFCFLGLCIGISGDPAVPLAVEPDSRASTVAQLIKCHDRIIVLAGLPPEVMKRIDISGARQSELVDV
jgi:hypothetical protein